MSGDSWLSGSSPSGVCVAGGQQAGSCFHLVGNLNTCKTTQGCGSGHYLQPLRRNWRALTLWLNYFLS